MELINLLNQGETSIIKKKEWTDEEINRAFTNMCTWSSITNNNLPICKWLFKHYKNKIVVDHNNDYSFAFATKNRHYKIAKFLAKILLEDTKNINKFYYVDELNQSFIIEKETKIDNRSSPITLWLRGTTSCDTMKNFISSYKNYKIYTTNAKEVLYIRPYSLEPKNYLGPLSFNSGSINISGFKDIIPPDLKYIVKYIDNICEHV